MTTKKLRAVALHLTETWGTLSAPLHAVGATAHDVQGFRDIVAEAHVLSLDRRKRLNSFAEAAMSIPFYSASQMEAMMSDPSLQTSLTWGMVFEAYTRRYEQDGSTRAEQAPTKQWIRNLLSGEMPAKSQKWPRMCVVFHELYESLQRDNPSPTPMESAKSPSPGVFGGTPWFGGVVVALLFMWFTPASAQVPQLVEGRYTCAHILHKGGLTDTIRTEVSASRWYRGNDGSQFCILTRLDGPSKGVKCVWKVGRDGVQYNDKIPVTLRGGGWWYTAGNGVQVELLFIPKQP